MSLRASAGLSPHLLRRHVANGAEHMPGLVCWRRRDGWPSGTCGLCRIELGQTEVENLDAPVFRHEDVFRLEIAVDDAGIVSGGQSTGNLNADSPARPAAASGRCEGDRAGSRLAATRSRCRASRRTGRRERSKRCSDDSARRRPGLPARSGADARDRATRYSGRTLMATSRFSVCRGRDRPRPCRPRPRVRRSHRNRAECPRLVS